MNHIEKLEQDRATLVRVLRIQNEIAKRYLAIINRLIAMPDFQDMLGERAAFDLANEMNAIRQQWRTAKAVAESLLEPL